MNGNSLIPTNLPTPLIIIGVALVIILLVWAQQSTAERNKPATRKEMEELIEIEKRRTDGE